MEPHQLVFLCSDHFDENCFTKNQEIAATLGMKRKLKPDAVDWFIVGRHSRYHRSVTDRQSLKTGKTSLCVCFLDPGQVVTINNVEENRAGRYVELVDWKWPTSKGNGLILVMTSRNGYQNSHLVPQNKR